MAKRTTNVKKDIARHAKQYAIARNTKTNAAGDENAARDLLLAAVERAGIEPDTNGVYQIAADGLRITIKPGKKVVSVI